MSGHYREKNATELGSCVFDTVVTMVTIKMFSHNRVSFAFSMYTIILKLHVMDNFVIHADMMD
jgi:hypothetical protein